MPFYFAFLFIVQTSLSSGFYLMFEIFVWPRTERPFSVDHLLLWKLNFRRANDIIKQVCNVLEMCLVWTNHSSFKQFQKKVNMESLSWGGFLEIIWSGPLPWSRWLLKLLKQAIISFILGEFTDERSHSLYGQPALVPSFCGYDRGQRAGWSDSHMPVSPLFNTSFSEANQGEIDPLW